MLNDGIEVFLKRVGRGTTFREYNRPGYERKFQSTSMHTFIEATDDERFTVHIRLNPDFNYFTAGGVQVRLYLDDHDEPDVTFHEKIEIPRNGKMYVIKDFMSKVRDQWMNGELAFGKVRADSDEDMMVIRKLSRNLGTIRVSVQRGFEEGDRVLTRRERATGHQPLSQQLGKDDAENTSVTHLIKYASSLSSEKEEYANGERTVNMKPIPAPKAATRFRPLVGKNGDTYHFEFRYRSYEQLVALDIAPAERPQPRTPGGHSLVGTPKIPRSQGHSSYDVVGDEEDDDEPLLNSPSYRSHKQRQSISKTPKKTPRQTPRQTPKKTPHKTPSKSTFGIKRERSELSPEDDFSQYTPRTKQKKQQQHKISRLLDDFAEEVYTNDKRWKANKRLKTHTPNNLNTTNPINSGPSTTWSLSQLDLPPTNPTTTNAATNNTLPPRNPLFSNPRLPFHDSLTLPSRSTSAAPSHPALPGPAWRNQNRFATAAPDPFFHDSDTGSEAAMAAQRGGVGFGSGVGFGPSVTGSVRPRASLADLAAAAEAVSDAEARESSEADAGMGAERAVGLFGGFGAEMGGGNVSVRDLGAGSRAQSYSQMQAPRVRAQVQQQDPQTEDEVAFAMQELELAEQEMALQRRALEMKRKALELRKKMAGFGKGGGNGGGGRDGEEMKKGDGDGDGDGGGEGETEGKSERED
ncbi:hypothetical protein K490DRAFT_60090 [Saccharata proteae CBS 121410]|uniref:DUF7918 domain-containing protein n=1 Tax=Saccharata proteae CBS 121410 TaxID=1314787 RepID=A0A9P4LV93_9PEZI|nr:hypothetical protein K490DRAFT_60090 [Saccharata proteae CBS 121410]